MDLQLLSKIDTIEYSTVYGYGRTSKNKTLVSTSKDVFKDGEELKKLIIKEKVDLKDKKVYFLKSVVFSRNKFIEKNPDVKLSRIENADIIIVDSNKISIPAISRIDLDVDSSGNHYLSGYSGSSIISRKQTYTSVGNHWNYAKTLNEIQAIKLLVQYKNSKKIVDVSTLELPSVNEFTLEVFNKVSDMLSGKDKELHKLALNILSEFDIEKDAEKFKLIFSLYEQSIRGVVWNVEIKTLMQRLSRKGIFLTMLTPVKWIELAAEHPDDEFYTSAINRYLRNSGANLTYKIKIVKI